MKPKFVLFISIILCGFLNAQDMQTWTWDSYKTKFKVPYDFEIKTNTADAFSAGNQDINLTIYPRKVTDMTYEKMEYSLSSWVNNNGVEITTEYLQLTDLNRYWGVLCDGTYQGFNVMSLMLVDPDYTDIALYIWCSYNQRSAITAAEIMYSFTPN
jgi:Dihydro-orotase-like